MMITIKISTACNIKLARQISGKATAKLHYLLIGYRMILQRPAGSKSSRVENRQRWCNLFIAIDYGSRMKIDHQNAGASLDSRLDRVTSALEDSDERR